MNRRTFLAASVAAAASGGAAWKLSTIAGDDTALAPRPIALPHADFARMYPKTELVRGTRFVEHDHVATAGGLTSGIDLALRVVERYLGREAVVQTARYLEYASRQHVYAI